MKLLILRVSLQEQTHSLAKVAAMVTLKLFFDRLKTLVVQSREKGTKPRRFTAGAA
jgi:hypothetical protein